MELFETATHPEKMILEQCSSLVFDCISSDSALIVLMDRDGQYWCNDKAQFDSLDVDRKLFRRLRANVDDGEEPVLTQHNEHTFIASGLSSQATHFGYIFMVIPAPGPETALVNTEFIEMMLTQMNLIISLIEQNHYLQNLQNQQMRNYAHCPAASN